MKTIMKALNRLIMFLYDLIEIIGTIVIILVILFVTAGIVCRYFLDTPLTWVEELCCVLLIYICYLAASLTTVEKGHIVADFLSSMLPKKVQKIESYVIRILEIIFLFFLCYATIKLIPSLTQTSAVLRLPRAVYYYPVAIFSGYMGLAIVVDLLNDLFPGYNCFAERQAERDRLAAEQQERENLEMIERENQLISDAGIEQKGGGTA